MLDLRRSAGLRLLAFLLLIGSPGLGGTALQAMHGCTERMPWLTGATDVEATSGHHGGTHQEAPAEQGCHCIGHCQATVAVASPSAAIAERVEHAPAGGPILPGESRVAPAGRVSHRLPPATAPPLS
jgi:hypothetical protein